MCINLKLDKKDDTKYWIFNKEVTKEEWDNRYNIAPLVKKEVESAVRSEAPTLELTSKQEDLISTRGEELKAELFKKGNWGKNHGNGDVLPRSFVVDKINELFQKHFPQIGNQSQTSTGDDGSMLSKVSIREPVVSNLGEPIYKPETLSDTSEQNKNRGCTSFASGKTDQTGSFSEVNFNTNCTVPVKINFREINNQGCDKCMKELKTNGKCPKNGSYFYNEFSEKDCQSKQEKIE